MGRRDPGKAPLLRVIEHEQKTKGKQPDGGKGKQHGAQLIRKRLPVIYV